MAQWTIDSLNNVVYNFEYYNNEQKDTICAIMNGSFPPAVYKQHCTHRSNARANSISIRSSLAGTTQNFPPYILPQCLRADPSSLKGFGLVFTAGGEGERLRLSLLKRGTSSKQLENFTKATFPLPDFYEDFGTLHINLTMISHFCTTAGIDIPVIVTTGPLNSITASVIPALLKKHHNFGLKHIRVIAQDERLHLTQDEKVVFHMSEHGLAPITQPDETGGPLMKLKRSTTSASSSSLEWFKSLGCTKTILMQATAIYEQKLLPLMAEALGNHDCCGVGILRTSFPASDPFGTYISLEKNNHTHVKILEQDIRNNETCTIKNGDGHFYLPFNTGFYAFINQLLSENDLPDFATPPKEILPNLPRSPKIGYAATDLISCAKKPIILAIEPSQFGVLKTADDLVMLSKLGKMFSLDQMCKTTAPPRKT